MSNWHTYTFCKLNTWFVLVLLFIVNKQYILAQKIDTTSHPLLEVTITETKQLVFQSSKKTTTLDSSILKTYQTTSLSELLSQQSTIHIKSYGNGNIATTSMRGGNSNHTAVLWNGLNIQNAMLGQSDLSIIPTHFFNSISLEHGGGSALWGSGAMGGSIHLQNKNLFNEGFKTSLQMNVGSFNTKKISTGFLLSYNKIISETKIYYNSSENNYLYKDTSDKINPNRKISHANYLAKGLMQNISLLILPNQKINIRAWYNNLFRNLPSYTNTISKQNQVDDNIKLNTDWNFSKQNLNTTIRLGYFNDKLNYTDSIINVFSKTKLQTYIAESDNLYQIKNSTLNFGVNYTQYNSIQTEKIRKNTSPLNVNDNYFKDTSYFHNLNKTALFLSYNLNAFNSKLNYNISLRKEFSNNTTIPITGSSGINYHLHKLITTKVNANKSYRQPTLNDLYWPKSGNPNLKPEEGYEIDGSLELNYKKKCFSLFLEGSYFNRHTTNWIIWLPNETGNWSPENIANVYSRGTETKTELSYQKQKTLVKLILNTSYVLSTNQTATSENDNSVGRQLIYTPRYNGQSSLILGYENLNLIINQTYTGYRFTSTDNSTWLYPYYLCNLRLSYLYNYKNSNINIFGNINNVFNKNYMVVSNRPMPLRNFELGLSINYHKPIKNNKTHNNETNNY